MKKRILSLFTAMALAFLSIPLSLPVSAAASSDAWTLDDEGVLTIIKDFSTDDWRALSDEVNAGDVKKLVITGDTTDEIFNGLNISNKCTNVESLVIGGNVKKVPYLSNKWPNVKNVTSVTFEEGVEELEANAFYSFKNLTEINLPNSITTIGINAFEYCSGLTTVNLSDSVTTIGEAAFYGCSSLTTISLPDSVTVIDKYVFGGCSSLTTISLPNNVVAINQSAFQMCTNLESIIMPANATVGMSAIPSSAAQITYADDGNGGVTVKVKSKGNQSTVTIPDNIGGKAVTSVDTNNTGVTVEHTHTGGTATCQNKAECTVCGQEYGELAAHTEVSDEAIEPTCTTAGKTEGKHCSVCDAVITAQTTVPALTHDFGEWTTTVEPTCKETGTKERTCKRAGCDETETDVIDKIAHTEETIPAVPPTCTATGLTAGVKCSACGTVLTTPTLVPAAGHSLDSGTVTTPASCTEKGVKTFSCANCDYTTTEEIPALGHSLDNGVETTPASCTEKGVKTFSCTNCDYTTTEEIPAAGHSLDNGVETTPASCTENGVKTFSCANCDYTETAEIPANGHNYVNGKCSVCQEVDPNHVCTGGAATCTQRAVCTICGKAYGNFAEHNYADGFCTVCNEPQPDHTHTGGTATCTQRAVCEICSNEYGNFGEHSFTNYIPDNNAACTADGTKTATCDNCAETKTVTDVGSATGHSFTNYVSNNNATCTADGTKTAVCDKCGVTDTVTDEGSKLGHNFVDGECTRCHSADPNYTPTVTEPTETEPTVTEPTVTEPTVTEPTVTEPTVTEPTVTEPTVTVPTVTEPPVTYPHIPSGTSPSYQTTAVNQSTNTSQKMIDTINFTADGGTAEIILSGTTKVDKTVFEAMQGRDITVVFKLSGGAYWTINGRDITKAKTVDLGVRLNKKAIPTSKIKELAGDKKTVQFTLNHSGDFGFTGILNVPFGKAYNGKFANLYYYSKKEFEFVAVSEISGGNGAFVFTHASDYVAVIDDYSYIEDVSSAAEIYENSEEAENSKMFTVILGMTIVVAFGIFYRKMRKKIR